jgi:hypothetical protein
MTNAPRKFSARTGATPGWAEPKKFPPKRTTQCHFPLKNRPFAPGGAIEKIIFFILRTRGAAQAHDKSID